MSKKSAENILENIDTGKCDIVKVYLHRDMTFEIISSDPVLSFKNEYDFID